MKYLAGLYLIFCAFVFVSCGPSPEQKYEQARQQVGSGNFNEAITLLNEVLKEQPERADAYNLRGVAYFELENNQEAISEFGQSIRLNGQDYRPYFNRAKAYRAVNDLPAALQDYNDVISRKPQLADAYLNRAVVLYEMQNITAAYRDMTEALNWAPNDSLTLLNSGKLFLQADSLQAAANSLTTLLASHPKQAEAYYLLGQVKRKQGVADEACTLFKQAVKAGFGKAQALANISCLNSTN